MNDAVLRFHEVNGENALAKLKNSIMNNTNNTITRFIRSSKFSKRNAFSYFSI